MTMAPEAPVAPTALRFLSLEITHRCQETCPAVCYVKAGPTRDHGTMTVTEWEQVIDEAAALGTEDIQLIGGEPTLHPAFNTLANRILGHGIRIRVYSNLYRVRLTHWELFKHPVVRLATTYYSSDPPEHDEATGRSGSHDRTRANIIEAVRRGIPIRVAVLDLGHRERAERARDELLSLGVTDVRISPVRPVGNAAPALTLPSTSSLCGRCGNGKAAVLPNGSVAPCEIGRFLTAGSVKTSSLASVLASEAWAQITARIRKPVSAAPCDPDCNPNQDTCDPAKSGPCPPATN